MNVKNRIKTLRLQRKIQENKEYAKEIGLSVVSKRKLQLGELVPTVKERLHEEKKSR